MKKNVDLTNCLLGLNFLILIFGPWAKKIVYLNFANLSTSFLTPHCISFSTSVAEEGEGQFLDNHPSLDKVGMYIVCP